MWIAITVAALLLVGAMIFSVRLSSISSEEAHRLVKEGARLVDVRSPSEYAAGHIDGAVNIPVDDLGRRMKEVGPTDRNVVVYCHSGMRSARAATMLKAAGYKAVHNLGAMNRW